MINQNMEHKSIYSLDYCFKFITTEVIPYIRELYAEIYQHYKINDSEITITSDLVYGLILNIPFHCYTNSKAKDFNLCIKFSDLDQENWKKFLSIEKQKYEEENKNNLKEYEKSIAND